MKLKLPARDLAYANRHRALDSHNQVKKKKMRKLLIALMMIIPVNGVVNLVLPSIKFVFTLAVLNYLRIVVDGG